MGWFFGSKGKKKSSRGSSRKSRSSEVTSPGRRAAMWLGAKAILVAALLVAAGYGWTHAAAALEDHVRHRHLEAEPGPESGDWLAADRIELVDFPFDGDFGQAVADGVKRRILDALDAWEYEAGDGTWRRGVQIDPLEGKVVETAYEAAGEDSWVSTVHRVERRYDGLRVYAQYRRPLGAVVFDDDRIDIIDPSGYVLWHDYNGASIRSLRHEQALPVIVGNLPHSPGEGERWGREDVQAGITLARLLDDHPHADRFEAIDVGHRYEGTSRVRLALQTADDGLIFWGSPPQQALPGEPSANLKIQRLSYIVRNHPEFHADGSRWVLDQDLNAPYPRKLR